MAALRSGIESHIGLHTGQKSALVQEARLTLQQGTEKDSYCHKQNSGVGPVGTVSLLHVLHPEILNKLRFNVCYRIQTKYLMSEVFHVHFYYVKFAVIFWPVVFRRVRKIAKRDY